MFRYRGHVPQSSVERMQPCAPTQCVRAGECRSPTKARPSGDCGTPVRHAGPSHRAPHTARIRADVAALRRLLLQRESRLRMRRACFGKRDNPSATRSPRNDSHNGTRPREPGSRILMCASSRKGLLDGEEPQLAALDEHGKLGLPLCKGPTSGRQCCPPYSKAGAMISANEFRARFSRDFTVPRLHDVISAISSYDFPSSSRRMNTCL